MPFINIDKMFAKRKTKDKKKIIEKFLLFLDRPLKSRYIKNRFNVFFFKFISSICGLPRPQGRPPTHISGLARPQGRPPTHIINHKIP